MPKNWFRFSIQEDLTGHNGVSRNGSTPVETIPEPEPPARPALPERVEKSHYQSFEQIYLNAAVKPPRLSYGILKIAEMVNSQHLSGMSSEAKRCSLLMAIEAAGVEVEDLLQDAVVRQRALNDYEETQQSKIDEFEAAKAAENNTIQAELDRLTSQYLSRIQANLDEVARAQDRFHAWQKNKQQESQRITEAATFCVPQGSVANNGSLTAVLERATLARR
jgi:hypothetical protein